MEFGRYPQTPFQRIIQLAPRLSAQMIVQRDKDIAFSQLDDELLSIDANTGYCYSLNESAGRVWELIATPMSINALCAQLCKEYVVDEVTCLSEVTVLLQGLCEAGLVRASAPAIQ